MNFDHLSILRKINLIFLAPSISLYEEREYSATRFLFRPSSSIIYILIRFENGTVNLN